MKAVWTFSWHFLVVLLVLAGAAIGVGLWYGVDMNIGDNMTAYKVGDEGPHVFRHGDRWVQQTLRGNREQGFWVEEKSHALDAMIPLEVTFPLDNSRFSVQARPEFDTPPVRYQDDQAILALSDIEGNYKSFRDFLISAHVINRELEWIFGRGHLVLVGDFVDRGASTTQVLWLIYRLEQSAASQGGRVHYILGNHEIKNLQGNFQSAHKKYFNVAGMLGKQQSELFGEASFLGRWMMSKNSMEVINGRVFVHGGLHPKLASLPYGVEDINRIVRSQYRQMWYPKRQPAPEDFLLDTASGPSWYRGYFEDDLTQGQVEASLKKLQAHAVVVGHTVTGQVKPLFEKKVYAIDVKHPLDYRETLPLRRSEGLRLEADKAWRVKDDGSLVAL